MPKKLTLKNKKIKVNNADWKLEFVNNLVDLYPEYYPTHLYGVCDRAIKTIFIDKKYHSKKDLIGTLIHEGIHAGNSKLTEKEVRRIEQTVTDILMKVGVDFKQNI